MATSKNSKSTATTTPALPPAYVEFERRQREGVHLSGEQLRHLSSALADVYHGARAARRLAVEVSAQPDGAEAFATAIENVAKVMCLKVDMIEQTVSGGAGFGDFAEEFEPAAAS